MLSYANRNWRGSVVRFKNIATRKQVKWLNAGGGGVVSVAYSPDGNFFASGQDDGTVRLWETAAFNNILPVFVGSNALSIVFGPVQYERKRQPPKYSLAVGCHDGSIKMLELSFIKDKNSGAVDVCAKRRRLSQAGIGAQQPLQPRRQSPGRPRAARIDQFLRPENRTTSS